MKNNLGVVGRIGKVSLRHLWVFIFLISVGSPLSIYTVPEGQPAKIHAPSTIGPPSPDLSPEFSIESNFIEKLTEDTWNYLSSDWATNNHFPWSWRSDICSVGGDYANPAEMGFYALSWLAAYDMQRTWSPTWSQTESEIATILNRLRAWQTGSQGSKPHGENAFNNSVFYQWYWISWSPPVVGQDVGSNHVVPSLDNAWLAASLITIRQYAEANGHATLAQKANAILVDMDFLQWYDTSIHRFYLGDVENPQGGAQADYYSNENRIINFIAHALGELSDSEYALSLDALIQSPGSYDGITVEKESYDGSFFTYTGPALFIREMETSYGTNTISPATLAQIKYAANRGYPARGLSDSFDIGCGPYVQQGSLPVVMSGSPESRPGLVTPHASVMALITPYETEAVENLRYISNTYACAYDDENGYGFTDSVMVNPFSTNLGKCSSRFSALNQEWIFLSLANYMNGFVWGYFYKDAGVVSTHMKTYEQTLGINRSNLNFWDQLKWVKSDPRTVTITNYSGSDVHIGTLRRSSGMFLLGHNTCTGATLAVGESCMFDVIFRPTGTGLVNGKITIPSDAPSISPTSSLISTQHIVTLTGNGLPGTQLVTRGGSFEQDNNNDTIPDYWDVTGLTGLDGMSNQYAKHGTYSVKLVGQSGKTKILKQTIAKNGSAGDDFLYVLWSKAQTVPSGFKYRTQVSFYNGASLVERRIKDYTPGTHGWEYRWLPITVQGNYTRIEIEIIYSLASGTVWFDSNSLKWAP